jgi:hypothetical protein
MEILVTGAASDEGLNQEFGMRILGIRASSALAFAPELRANMRRVSKITADRGPAVARMIAKGYQRSTPIVVKPFGDASQPQFRQGGAYVRRRRLASR